MAEIKSADDRSLAHVTIIVSGENEKMAVQVLEVDLHWDDRRRARRMHLAGD